MRIITAGIRHLQNPTCYRGYFPSLNKFTVVKPEFIHFKITPLNRKMQLNQPPTHLLDVLIIGGGPIGMACGIECEKAKLSYVIVERGCLVNSLYRYPLLMTRYAAFCFSMTCKLCFLASFFSVASSLCFICSSYCFAPCSTYAVPFVSAL